MALLIRSDIESHDLTPFSFPLSVAAERGRCRLTTALFHLGVRFRLHCAQAFLGGRQRSGIAGLVPPDVDPCSHVAHSVRIGEALRRANMERPVADDALGLSRIDAARRLETSGYVAPTEFESVFAA